MPKYQCPICSKPCEDPSGCFKHKKRKPLQSSSKLRPRKKTKEEIEKNKQEADRMWAFYEYLWNKIEVKKCWSCDARIWGDNLSIYHDHLLEKSVYEHLKYEEENMFFCCGDCHTKKTNGHPTAKHQQAIDQAKKRFGIL